MCALTYKGKMYSTLAVQCGQQLAMIDEVVASTDSGTRLPLFTCTTLESTWPFFCSSKTHTPYTARSTTAPDSRKVTSHLYVQRVKQSVDFMYMCMYTCVYVYVYMCIRVTVSKKKPFGILPFKILRKTIHATFFLHVHIVNITFYSRWPVATSSAMYFWFFACTRIGV